MNQVIHASAGLSFLLLGYLRLGLLIGFFPRHILVGYVCEDLVTFTAIFDNESGALVALAYSSSLLGKPCVLCISDELTGSANRPAGSR